jgi:hypothetical protein
MGQGRFRLLYAMGLGLCLMALAFTGSAAASGACGQRLLADWRDGRIDGTYPVTCYRQALANLPEDVRVYSTAQTDITRALQARLGIQATHAEGSATGGSGGGAVSPLLVVAITAAILVAAGSVAAALR